MTKPARYKNKLTIYKQGTPGRDPVTGLPTEPEYVPHTTIWAKVENMFREQLQVVLEGQTLNRDRIKVTTRFREDLDSTMVVGWKGRHYQMSIVGDNKGDGKEVEFLAEEVVDGGYK